MSENRESSRGGKNRTRGLKRMRRVKSDLLRGEFIGEPTYDLCVIKIGSMFGNER